MFYVYFLLDPLRSYLPFYIGKGSGDRAYEHLLETKCKTNIRKFNRIKRIRQFGKEPAIMFWKTDMLEQDAFDLEETLIAKFGRQGYEAGGILTNFCISAKPPGMRNCQNPEEVKARISASMTGPKNHFYGKKHTAESLVKIGSANRGKTLGPEWRQKLSEAQKGKAKPEGFGEKISSALKGRKKTPEHVAKLPQNQKGRKISEAHKAKISATFKGRKKTPEHIAKIAAANRARKR